MVVNDNGGERSKRKNNHFEFQISFLSIFPPLRLKFGPNPIITQSMRGDDKSEIYPKK